MKRVEKMVSEATAKSSLPSTTDLAMLGTQAASVGAARSDSILMGYFAYEWPQSQSMSQTACASMPEVDPSVISRERAHAI